MHKHTTICHMLIARTKSKLKKFSFTPTNNNKKKKRRKLEFNIFSFQFFEVYIPLKLYMHSKTTTTTWHLERDTFQTHVNPRITQERTKKKHLPIQLLALTQYHLIVKLNYIEYLFPFIIFFVVVVVVSHFIV